MSYAKVMNAIDLYVDVTDTALQKCCVIIIWFIQIRKYNVFQSELL
jgi:hypothetical protein